MQKTLEHSNGIQLSSFFGKGNHHCCYSLPENKQIKQEISNMSIYRESSFASNYINPGLPVLMAERDLFYFVKSLCKLTCIFSIARVYIVVRRHDRPNLLSDAEDFGALKWNTVIKFFWQREPPLLLFTSGKQTNKAGNIQHVYLPGIVFCI
jgi:hypothetical protein